MHFRIDFIMEANTMTSDRTAPKHSDQGQYCLKWLPKTMQIREQMKLFLFYTGFLQTNWHQSVRFLVLAEK